MTIVNNTMILIKLLPGSLFIMLSFGTNIAYNSIPSFPSYSSPAFNDVPVPSTFVFKPLNV